MVAFALARAAATSGQDEKRRMSSSLRWARLAGHGIQDRHRARRPEPTAAEMVTRNIRDFEQIDGLSLMTI